MNRHNYISPRSYGNEATLFINPAKKEKPNKKSKKPSILISFFIVGLFFSALLTYSAYAENPVEQPESWRVFKTADEIVIVDRHGLITHGDRLKYAFFPGQCDQVFTYFSVYSVAQNNDFLNLQDRYLSVSISSDNNVVNIFSTVYVMNTHPFLMGHIADLSLGYHPFDDVVRDFRFIDELSIEIIEVDDGGSELINVADYFDIPKNAWDFGGFANAMFEGQNQCYQISEMKLV